MTTHERLADLVAGWRAHRTEIQAAYSQLDLATARVLEETEIAWLYDVAEAAETLVDAPS